MPSEPNNADSQPRLERLLVFVAWHPEEGWNPEITRFCAEDVEWRLGSDAMEKGWRAVPTWLELDPADASP